MAKYHTNPMGDYSKKMQKRRNKNSAVHQLLYPKKKRKKSGCYVATCIYGSYDCPQVWTLRRYRDEVLEQSWVGRMFVTLYYAISPIIVRCVGNTQLFNYLLRPILDKKVKKLNDKGFQSTRYYD